MSFASLLLAATVSVNFNSYICKFRPELHSSSYGPTIAGCSQKTIDEIKEMGFKSARTHDWALANSNQRVCDYHHIFPIIHLDATNPSNYVFAATDYLLKRAREDVGTDIFFRLGVSIEHSGPKVHFNSLIPDDFDKVAEIFAGTIRHYNYGWADGHKWGIKYWEIWNEPDNDNTMWCLKDGDLGIGSTPEEKAKDKARRDKLRMELFCKFYVTCLKRLKSEFPDIKVGGPALCYMREDYFRALLKACKEADVAPDFISWHQYTNHPQAIINSIEKGRSLCDEYGFKDCELIINEWHYLGPRGWGGVWSCDPEILAKTWQGPSSHNGIDSSCFNLTVLSKFQTSKLDQAFYYGCFYTGAWGYKNSFGNKYKIYHGLKMFSSIVHSLSTICESKGEGTVTVIAGKSKNGRSRGILVTDYMGTDKEIVVKIDGVEDGRQCWVIAHDNERDFEPVYVPFNDGKLVLKKTTEGSAAFTIWF